MHRYPNSPTNAINASLQDICLCDKLTNLNLIRKLKAFDQFSVC